MTDDEVRAVAAAVKTLLDQRDITLRTELADTRATCEALHAEVQELRAKVAVLPSAMREDSASLMRTVGDKLGAALPAAVEAAAGRIFERRAAELEQRAMPGATQ